jgi:hypothetical protein
VAPSLLIYSSNLITNLQFAVVELGLAFEGEQAVAKVTLNIHPQRIPIS